MHFVFSSNILSGTRYMLPPFLLIGHCLETKADSDSPAEQKPCIVKALYDSLDIMLSCTELEKLSEQHPTRWWQNIAYHIRMWRRVDFASRQVSNLVMALNLAQQIEILMVSL